jgi:hypothetical protein
MEKRIVISVAVIIVALLPIVAGCVLSRDTVRVTNAVSGSPVRGAQVVPIYPSLAGAVYTTDKRGVARVAGFGLPRGAAGYSVEVSASGYTEQSVPMFGSQTNHLEVALSPTNKP